MASMILAVLAAAQFLLALDYSIVYVALPVIARDLGLPLGAAQWVVSAYAVPFAGLLLVGGRLADRFGAGRLFLVAVLLFGLSCAVAGLAGGGTVLLAARGVQGLAAALLQPAILGLIGARFPAGPARTRALSVWGAVGASGLAAGVVLGGLLTAYSWRLTFFVNVPVTLACAAGAAVWLRPGQQRRAPGAPLTRTLIATTTTVALALGLTLGSVALVAAAVLLGLTLIGPVVRLRPRALRTGSLAAALYMASVGSEFYVVTLMLQDRDGYAPPAAGLAFLPLAALVTVGSSLTERLVRRFGLAPALGGAFLVAGLGLGWLAVASDLGYPAGVLPGLLVSGAAHGVIYTAMFVLGARDVPAERQSSAGATMTTAQYLAGAVAVAALTLPLHGGAYAAAFWLTAAAAVAGAALVLGPRMWSATTHG
ncbi:MFS transporter [Dactylosporangium vinaceum]|uniref:MFS transporter n=1 Tax=Dactylosporangium vinaceum TaxID=53362 RepID=A0ABV5M8A2_9ACTN|nr:MFS transporter [Dactylosporangium vinaceum]UAB94248.1 MFS transporter [Dactylosporangium vinaceum]